MVGFGARLSSLRQQRGLSRADLARLVGVSQPAVYNWEQNDKLPRTAGIAALCKVLGTTEDYLVRGKGTAETTPAAKSVNKIIEDAKGELATALGMPAARVQLTFQVVA